MLEKIMSNKEYQQSVAKGIDKIFSIQKKMVDSTFDFYEKGVNVQKDGYEKTKSSIEQISAQFEKQIISTQDTLKKIMYDLGDKYLPESQNKLEDIDKMLHSNVEKVTAQIKTVLNENVDGGIQKLFGYEKETIKKLRKNVESFLNTHQKQVADVFGIAAPKKSTARKKTAAEKTSTTAKKRTKASQKTNQDQSNVTPKTKAASPDKDETVKTEQENAAPEAVPPTPEVVPPAPKV